MSPEPPDLRVRTTQIGDACTLELAGEIDLFNSTRVNLEFELILSRSPPPATVRVDLGDVTFMDSIGVAVLLSARRAAESVGCCLLVTSASPMIARLFGITGLTDLLMDSAE